MIKIIKKIGNTDIVFVSTQENVGVCALCMSLLGQTLYEDRFKLH